jgi:hypothetical protein
MPMSGITRNPAGSQVHDPVIRPDRTAELEARITDLEAVLREVRQSIIDDLMSDGCWRREAETAPLPARITAALKEKT